MNGFARLRIFVIGSALVVVGFGCDEQRAPLQTQKPISTSTAPGVAIPQEPAPTPAEREQALERIEKAIVAHGGPVRMNKLRQYIIRMKGTIFISGHGYRPVEQELMLRFPDQIRLVAKLSLGMGVQITTQAVRGDSGWYQAGLQSTTMVAEQVGDVQGELHFWRVLTLMPLRETESIIRPVPGIEVAGLPTVGVRVGHKLYPPVNLYFDAKTNLLVKTVGMVREAGRLHTREVTFSEFKTFADLQLPTSLNEIRDNELFQKCTMDYAIPGVIEDKDFVQP